MATSASQAMVATQAIFMSLAMLTVGLRLHLRLHTSPPLKADDYLILVALLFSIALAVTNIVGVPVGGFGLLFESLSEATAIQFLKILFVLQFFYLFAVAFIKLSVLYFYGRIFSVRHMRPVFKYLIVITIAWLVAFFFATLFQIWPIVCNWSICKATINYPVMYVVCSVTDIVLDIAILYLPAAFIRELKMDRERKIAVGGIFGLGIFCVVSSIARLAYTADYLSLNPTINAGPSTNNAETNIILWSGIEACASTICANLPFYGPLLARSRRGAAVAARLQHPGPGGKSYSRFGRSPSRTRTGAGMPGTRAVSLYSNASRIVGVGVEVGVEMPVRALEKVRTASLDTEVGSRRGGRVGGGFADVDGGLVDMGFDRVDLGKEMELEMGGIGVAKTTGF